MNARRQPDSLMVKERFNEAFPVDGPIRNVDIAKALGVTRQAVTGWRRDGRIAKTKLPGLAILSGRPVQWWMGGTATMLDELMEWWEYLRPDQKQDVIDAVRAHIKSNLVIGKHLDGPIEPPADTKIELAYGQPPVSAAKKSTRRAK